MARTEPADADDDITLYGLLIEAQHDLTRRLEADLATVFPHPMAWFEVLLRLARTPGGALPMTRLAEMVLFSSGGFTKLADRMEAAGLIRRMPCPDDRRSSLASLTPAGEALLGEALAVHRPSLRRHLGDRLSPTERQGLEAILRVLRDDERDPVPPG